MRRLALALFALVAAVAGCGPEAAAPPGSAIAVDAPPAAVLPASAAPTESASASLIAPSTPIATCTLAALPVDPDRGYCFAYYDGAVAALAGICKELQGRFAARGACASERHVGTCSLPDGSERWSYAPATPEVARKQCDAVPGGRFFALGEPVAHAAASSFACDDPPRGVCRETRVASPAALAEARRQCVGLGTGRDGPCPDKNRVAICQSLVPFLRDHYYAPKFDAGSARKDCAGTIVP